MQLSEFIQQLQELQRKCGEDTEVIMADMKPVANPVYKINAVVITDEGLTV